MTRRTVRFIIEVMLLCVGLQAPLPALTLVESRWGFDGQVVPDHVNLLSVLLVNEGAAPFNGALRLERSTGIGSRIGAPQDQACYIAPRGSRWVQFYTLNKESDEDWALRWGGGARESVTLTPRVGPPARVLFVDSTDIVSRRYSVKSFPEEVFPVTVAATDGLSEVLIDHAPRWEPARREAFMDWLRRGGTVHLLLGSDGRHPAFMGEMTPLNDDRNRFRVGAGLVVRHRLSRVQVTDATLRDAGFPGLALHRQNDYGWLSDIGETFVREMSVFTRPHHSWGILYIVVAVYILFIGPVNFLLGRKWRDWRRTTLLYLGLVAATCLALGFLGRRGNDEAAIAHKVAYARPSGPGTYDVTQWVNAFVTSGGDYTVEYPAPINLYAPLGESESINGIVRNGPGGTFVVDMPLFSSRAFVHRGRMPGPDLGLKLISAGGEDGDGQVSIACGAGFPRDVLEIHAIANRRLHTLTRKGDLLESVSGRRILLAEEALKIDPSDSYHDYSYSGGQEEGSPAVEEVYRKMNLRLIGYALGGPQGFRYRCVQASASGGREGAQEVDSSDEAKLPLSDDCVHVFVYARAPESFALVRNPFGREDGYVLYHVILPRVNP